MANDTVDTSSDQVREEQRKDPEFARQRFEMLLPDRSVREACLSLLADSIERVHQKFGPARWGLTLRLSKKIHLNVGRLLALGIHDKKIFIALEKNALSTDVLHLLNARGEPQEDYVGFPNIITRRVPADLVADLRPQIERAYFDFLDLAANTATQTPYRNSHSPGAIRYLQQTLDRLTLPNPMYQLSVSTPPRYWKIAPGEQGKFWTENLQGQIIAIGWGQAGDPRGYSTKETLAWFLAGHYSHYNAQEARANVRQLWSFIHNIKPGDVIVANRGQSKILGRGVVLGPAEFRAERGEYGNCLPVRWFDTQERDIPKQNSWSTPVMEIQPTLYTTLFGPDPDTGENGSPPSQPMTNHSSIYDYLQQHGLHFPTELVTTYLLSLKTKPFVILSGISGTGKTKLAQAIAEWATGTPATKERQHEFISVRPDWLDGKEVLGFYNILTEEYTLRPFSRLLLQAHRRRNEPHFVILDEMNLARVEHYFADLLSATESRTRREDRLHQEALHLHDKMHCLPMAPPEGWTRPERCGSCRATADEIANCDLHFDDVQMVPPKLPVPTNVYITGTVNIDETTHMFSPKVLDRANVIEFNDVDLLEKNRTAPTTAFVLKDGTIDLGTLTIAELDHFRKASDKVRTMLAELNEVLREANLHFGYRVANEIALYVEHASHYVGPEAVDTALDLQILQKILPKLHGSKQKLLEPLWRLLTFAIYGKDVSSPYRDQDLETITRALKKSEPINLPNVGNADTPALPRCTAKLVRMLRILRSQGFVSFIE